MENKYAIESNNLSIHYGSYTAVKRCKREDPAAKNHSDHWPIWLWQIHTIAGFESNE